MKSNEALQRIRQGIERNLEDLSYEEMVEVDYFLSSYKKSPTSGQHGHVPMHFFGRFLGLTQLANDKIAMKLGLQNENTYGVAQGGSLYTLADVAIGFMILNKLSESQKVFTLEMKVNFIKKGEGSQLIASPSIIRWGERTVVSECTIEDAEGDVVAKALGTFYVVS